MEERNNPGSQGEIFVPKGEPEDTELFGISDRFV